MVMKIKSEFRARINCLERISEYIALPQVASNYHLTTMSGSAPPHT